MTGENAYKEFDSTSIVSDATTVGTIKFGKIRFRKRDLVFGGIALLALLLVLVLAIVLAIEVGGRNDSDDDDGGHRTAAAVQGNPNRGASTGNPSTGNPNTTQSCDHSDMCLTTQCLRTASYQKSSMEEQISPCDDFYSFACGHFDDNNPQTYLLDDVTPMNKIGLDNFYKIVDILSFPVEKPNTSSYERKLKHFWSSCTNHFDKMDLRGRPLVEKVLRQVAPTYLLDDDFDPAQFDLNLALRETHVDFWTAAFFTMNVVTDQTEWTKKVVELNYGGLAFSYRLYIHSRYADQVLALYKEYMTHVLTLVSVDAGVEVNSTRLDTMTDDVIFVEQNLAYIVSESPELLAPHLDVFRLPLRNLTELVNGTIDFTQYMQYAFHEYPGLFTDDTTVSVRRWGFFHRLGGMLAHLAESDEGKRQLSNYLVWVLINRYSHDLSWDYVHAKRKLDNYLYGQKDSSSGAYYCFEMARMSMPDAMDAEFVKYYVHNENKAEAQKILEAVRSELLSAIDKLEWMTEQDRDTAHKKISESLYKIGYADYMVQDTYMDGLYAAADIDEADYFGNILNLNKLFRREFNRRIGEQNSRTLWAYHIFDPVVEYYNPWHELIATSAVFQNPLFNHNGPAYYNMGSVGTLIAKHLIHAVDEIGSLYSMDRSHYGDWWSNTTLEHYRSIKACAMDAQREAHLGTYELFPGMVYEPNVTDYAMDYAPELLADASGLHLAFQTFKKLQKDRPETMKMPPGFPGRTIDQLFFMAYAQTNCQNTPDSVKLYQLDGNKYPSKARVNLAVAQVPEFAEVFQCSSGQRMAPEKQCTLF